MVYVEKITKAQASFNIVENMEKIAIIFPGFVMFMLLVFFGAVEVTAQTENLPDDEGTMPASSVYMCVCVYICIYLNRPSSTSSLFLSLLLYLFFF